MPCKSTETVTTIPSTKYRQHGYQLSLFFRPRLHIQCYNLWSFYPFTFRINSLVGLFFNPFWSKVIIICLWSVISFTHFVILLRKSPFVFWRSSGFCSFYFYEIYSHLKTGVYRVIIYVYTIFFQNSPIPWGAATTIVVLITLPDAR